MQMPIVHPGYVITAFEMIEMLKNQGAEGKMNQS